MPTATLDFTLADVVQRLGDIPLERIPASPAPGTAREEDLFSSPTGEKRLYELVDGVLVEKPMGYYESILAAILIRLLGAYVEEHTLGVILGEAGTLRLAPGLVRVPDVAFISWERFPGRVLPREAVLDLAPDLAVEILSKSNTASEMSRKVREYFQAGTRLVWLVDPEAVTVTVCKSPENRVILTAEDTLSDEALLPGFSLPVADWFRKAGPRE